MARNLIVFSDGTSNTKTTNTNVYQFYKALKDHESNLCFYDPGVGSFKADVLGKAFGAGVADNIKQMYQFIVKNYEDGDRIFAFGFSRGAYTVRSLVGFITLVGLVTEKDNRKKRRPKRTLPSPQTVCIRRAYNTYRANKTPIFKDALKLLGKRQEMKPCSVFGLGVWDTVGAIGLPNFDKDKAAYGDHYYHHVALPKDITHAYHALSLDDERRNFAPVMFNRTPNNTDNIREVWFPGMHSDVGGGYKTLASDPGAKDLSNISLKWMADRFSRVLSFDRSEFGAPKPKGVMHDSANEKLYEVRVRTVPKHSILHPSVVQRIKGPLESPSPTREPNGVYRPASLKQANFDADPVWGLDEHYVL